MTGEGWTREFAQSSSVSAAECCVDCSVLGYGVRPGMVAQVPLEPKAWARVRTVHTVCLGFAWRYNQDCKAGCAQRARMVHKHGRTRGAHIEFVVAFLGVCA